MTCDEKYNALLEIFQRVALLSNKNGCQTIRLRHRRLGRDLVLHRLPEPRRAYEILRALRCEQLPAVYETFTLDDGMLVLEEYIDGLTVAEVAEAGRYRRAGALRVMREVCAGLSVLHENGIVHRDVKPENVMVDASGRVVLLDFNTSRSLSQNSRDTVVMGTVGFAPPEQLGVAQTDARTDVYAAGVMLNVLLTGKHPTERLAPGRYGRIVRKCTAVNPNDRYPTAKALAAAL